MDKYLIVQPWGMGDVIMASPMATALGRTHPTPNIIDFLIGNRGAFSFLNLAFPKSSIHYFDHRRRSIVYTLIFFYNLRKKKYKAAYLAANISFLYALFLKVISDIPQVHWEGKSSFLHIVGVICHTKHAGHRVARNLALTGIQGSFSPTIWPIPSPYLAPAYRPNLPALITDWIENNRKIIVIHPGSSIQQSATKRPPIGLVQLITETASELDINLKVIRIFGPEEFDLSLSYSESNSTKNLKVNCIEEATYVISKAVALIAGDSGYGHIAASVGIPVITIAGPTDIESTRPWGARAMVLKTREILECMPCYGTSKFKKCPYNQRCMNSISVEDVKAVLNGIIND